MVMFGRILTLVALLVLVAPDAYALVLSPEAKAPEIVELSPVETTTGMAVTPRCVSHCSVSVCLPGLTGAALVLAVPTTQGAAIGDAHRTRGDPADLDIVTPPPRAAV